MPWWAWIPLRSVSTVPLVGIGLCAAGLLYGTYDLTEKVARRVIPNRHRTSTTSNAVGWLAATAGAGATFQVGEALFRPAPVPPPKLSGGASMDARVRDFMTSTRHVLQNYPYKYRAINTVLMGVVAASSRVVADRLYCHQFNAPLEPLAPSNSKAAAVAAAGTPHDRPQPLESSGKREKVAGEGRTGSAATAPADSPGIFGWLQKRAEERRARKGSAAVDGASAASAASASSAELGTTDRGARARDAPPAETEAASEPDEGGGLAASVESDAVPESAAEAEAAEAESEAESDSLADRADASAKSGERLALPTSFSRVGDGAYSSSSSSFGNPGAYAGASSSSLPTDPFAAADSDVVEDLQPDEDKYAGDSSREA